MPMQLVALVRRQRLLVGQQQPLGQQRLADVEQQPAKGEIAQLVHVQAQVPPETRRPHRACQRMVIGEAVLALDLAQPAERGRIARDRADHVVHALPQLLQVQAAAVLEVVEDLPDPVRERVHRRFGTRQFRGKVGLHGPGRPAQLGELVLLARGFDHRFFQFDPARIGRTSVGDVDVDVVADALQRAQVLVGIDRETLQRETGFEPRAIQAADEHADLQTAHADADFLMQYFHSVPLTGGAGAVQSAGPSIFPSSRALGVQ